MHANLIVLANFATMANYQRFWRPGAAIFFTHCLQNKRSDLLVREINCLRFAVAKTRVERPFEILAWVVLPQHMHCVWRLPKDDCDYATRWKVIKARFSHGLARHVREAEPTARSISNVRRREAGIWQRRYWEHHCRGAQDLADCIEFCHASPVIEGLVKTPEAWPHSSLHHQKKLSGVA